MNIKEAKQEVIHTILAYTAKNQWGNYAIPQGRQRPLLLIGPPGIGKTAIMEQAATECGVGFVSYTMTHHTRQSAIGLPYISHQQFDGHEYSVTEYTMSEIIASVYRCIKESGKKEGLLFLDEINCVSETLAPVMLQFLQNKTFGNQRLPEGWVLAAAGNPQEYNKSVREFDLATLDRLKYITVEADYEAWRPYALSAGIHGAILSYLDTHKDRFYVLQQTFTEKTFATARGWEDLSCILLQYEALHLPVTPDLMAQYLHCEDLARDFYGYYHLYTTRQEDLPVLPMLSGDADGTAKCQEFLTGTSFDEKLLLVHTCLSALNSRLQEYENSCCRLSAFQNVLERLQRYQKQTGTKSLPEVLPSFLKKEEDILLVRREHALSSEQELQNTKAMLYELRQLLYEYQSEKTSMPQASHDQSSPGIVPADDAALFLEAARRAKESSLASDADQLSSMIDQCLNMFLPANGPEYTVLLSSLSQNALFTRFIKKYPSALFKAQSDRLKLRSREEQLRQELSNLK